MVSRPLQIVLPRTQSIVRERVVETQPVDPQAERDTQGNVVPIWKPHSYTYDLNNNLTTDTVTDGVYTWVRTFTYANGNQATDSGWVKQ